MRTFYIFKINQEFSNLLKNSPYNLFKTLEQIYYLNKNDLQTAFKMFETIAIPINKRKLNIEIFDEFKDNENYTKFSNTHMINNYYTDEKSRLTIKNSHLILTSTNYVPSYFKILSKQKNLFVCDFKNQDYFWLSEIKV